MGPNVSAAELDVLAVVVRYERRRRGLPPEMTLKEVGITVRTQSRADSTTRVAGADQVA